MGRSKWMAGIVGLALLLIATAAQADLYEAAQATVRVRCGNGVGSGIVVGSNDGAYFALTNAHVADKQTCTIEFFSGGRMSAQVPNCKTVSRDVNNDVAVVQISKRQLSGHVPSIIPIDPAYELTTGIPIGSIGHPHGENPTAFMGAYVKMTGGSICFRPAPKQGRSGSALFDKDFTRVVGLIWGCDADSVKDQLGYAVPARKFSTALGRELTKVSVASSEKIDFGLGQRLTCFDANVEKAPQVEKAEIELKIGDLRLGLKEDRKGRRREPLPPGGPRRAPEILPLPPAPMPKPFRPWRQPPPILPPKHAAEWNALNWDTIILCQYSSPCLGGSCPSGICPGYDGAQGYSFPGYSCPEIFDYPVQSCPNGSCPASGSKRNDNKAQNIVPTTPIPIENVDDIPSVLPEPEIQPESTPVSETLRNKSKASTAVISPKEIPVAIADPRLEKLNELPAIKTGLFNMAGDTQTLKENIAQLVVKLRPIIDGIEIDEYGQIVKLKELEERFETIDEMIMRINPLITKIQLDQDGNVILPDAWQERLKKLDSFDGNVKVDWGLPTVHWSNVGVWFWNLLIMVVAGVGVVHLVGYIQNRNVK